MSNEELVRKYAPSWPYPVNYGKENEVRCDVLVIGGGLAGCHTAINAVKKGAKVAVVDKGAVIRSGSGGSGIDHYSDTNTNPCCKITPEEMQSAAPGRLNSGGYFFGHTYYITCKESYDALLDMEKMGLEIRDVDDEFAGAPFRDDETKLMFSYDYENKHDIKLRGGANMKPILYKECKRLGVDIYNRVMVTSLLTEGGKPGAKVIGATGVNVRTGEFYIFKAKATVLATAAPTRLWVFSTELAGSHDEHWDPNDAGDGYAMGWEVGAEFAGMETSRPGMGPPSYPVYGTGNWGNTWYACTIVDANGKEVPWVDKNGKILKTVAERYSPAAGQKLMANTSDNPDVSMASIIPDLEARVMKGEFIPPFFADLPSMPEYERRAIFGLMVGNEGVTRIPIYYNYTKAGFDPDKDMLEAPQVTGRSGSSKWRTVATGNPGTLVVDWDLKTNLEGLYAAGMIGRFRGCSGASASGRYVGRKAAEAALKATEVDTDRKQIEAEKERVYAPVMRKNGVGWKELHAGVCKIMQQYCGEYKSEGLLKMGLDWLNSIRENEASKAFARNPHELKHILECQVRLTVCEMIIQASLARKASSKLLDFKRIDYPAMDPPEWNKFLTIKLENGEAKVGELPLGFWLKPPFASTLQENYRIYSGF
jgi:succinate dehydrogenase/fumarate reductase flavoprotein subunit